MPDIAPLSCCSIKKLNTLLFDLAACNEELASSNLVFFSVYKAFNCFPSSSEDFNSFSSLTILDSISFFFLLYFFL